MGIYVFPEVVLLLLTKHFSMSNSICRSGSSDSDDSDAEEEKKTSETIVDATETNLIALRRTIYLTIQV